jgi:hypothetical protein
MHSEVLDAFVKEHFVFDEWHNVQVPSPSHRRCHIWEIIGEAVGNGNHEDANVSSIG